MKDIFYPPKNVQVEDQVLILSPLYVAQKLGVICGWESDLDSEHKQRWIIQVELDNIVVSLTEDEFCLINHEQKDGEQLEQDNQADRNSFFNPRAKYHGRLTPQNLVFNTNFQEFSQKVTYISALETSGKISPDEAYRNIKALWKQFKSSTTGLGICNHKPEIQ